MTTLRDEEEGEDEAGEDAAKDSMEHEELVAQVKERQRESNVARRAWSSYCDSLGAGVRDPKKHSSDFLWGFLSAHSEGWTGEGRQQQEVDLIEVSSREPALGVNQITLRMPPSEEGIMKEVVTTNVYRFLPGRTCVLHEGDKVLDVGAHVGVAAALALRTPKVRVVCVEPHPTTFAILCQNMAEHGESVCCVNKAVTGTRGAQPLYIHSGTNAPSRLYFSSLFETRRHNDDTISVECTPFQELVDQHSPTVIKIDAEGAERFLSTLSDLRGVRLIVAEWDWTHNRHRGDWECVETHLRSNGFSVEVIGRMPQFNELGDAELHSASKKKRGNTGMIFSASRKAGGACTVFATNADKQKEPHEAATPSSDGLLDGAEAADGAAADLAAGRRGSVQVLDSAPSEYLLEAGAQPALRDQLAALTVEQLQGRLDTFGAAVRLPRPEEFVQGFRAARRQELLDALCAEYAARASLQPRRIVREAGVRLPAEELAQLLEVLRMMAWTENVRPAVCASGYAVLKRPWQLSSVQPRWRPEDPRAVRRRVWELSEALLRGASTKAASFDFTAIAVSKNFRGSPHVDKNDLAVQYALSLGEFDEGGGELCVEESPFVVRAFDTCGKLVCIDGRFPHWVSGYTGERYSIIYYRSAGECEHSVQAVHDV